MPKPVKDIKEAKKILDSVMIRGILEYVKNGTFPGNSPNSYMDAYTTVQTLADEGDSESESLFKYHNEIIRKFIDDCAKQTDRISPSQLVDTIIRYTENINFLIYWMNRIFTYLDRFYTKSKGKDTLAKNALNSYRDNFFVPNQTNIFKELNKLIKDDRNKNTESRQKIKTILKIVDDLDLASPKIMKENNKISWVAEPNTESKNGKEIADIWYEKSFKRETEEYAKQKAQNDIKTMSAPEYISTILSFLEDEYTRENLYINKRYHAKINEIDCKYLVGQNAEALGSMDTGIPYMFTNKRNEELKKAYILLKKHPGSEGVLTKYFDPYIRKRGQELANNKEIVKDPRKFVPELIKLKNEMDELVSSCFDNDSNFQNTKNKSFSIFMGKSYYSKSIANYTDYCLRVGIKGKSHDEIEKILNEIVGLFNCLQNKLDFQTETNKKMSDRFLKKAYLSEEAERTFISKLKLNAGPTYVNKMSEMINDLDKNKRESESYKTSSSSKGKPNGIKFEVMVISQGAWDINQKVMEKLEIPKFLSTCMDDFERFYLKSHSGQKLVWCLGLSKLEIQYLTFPKKYISISTLPQYLTLLQLEKYGTLNLNKIKELLGCNINTVITDLPGLVYNPSFNRTSHKDKGLISGNWDGNTREFKEDTEISFNQNFQFNGIKFNTNPLQLKKTAAESKEIELEEAAITKRYQDNILQATITRIMKSRIGQKTTHVWLVNETAKQIDLFKAQPQQIKENIEKLIEKNIIKRNENDRTCYEYIS